MRILLFGTLLKPTVGTDAENTNSLAETHAHLREHPSSCNLSLEQELPLDHVVWIMFDSCLFLRSPWTVSSMRTTSTPVCLLCYSQRLDWFRAPLLYIHSRHGCIQKYICMQASNFGVEKNWVEEESRAFVGGQG